MHYCYMIASGSKTYVGYTTNLTRRIRQHNSEIKGGARRTTMVSRDKSQPRWEYIVIFSCKEWNRIRALQVEYTCKYPTRKKPCPLCFRGVRGKIESIEAIMLTFLPGEDVKVYVSEQYQSLSPTSNIIPENLGTLSESESER